MSRRFSSLFGLRRFSFGLFAGAGSPNARAGGGETGEGSSGRDPDHVCGVREAGAVREAAEQTAVHTDSAAEQVTLGPAACRSWPAGPVQEFRWNQESATRNDPGLNLQCLSLCTYCSCNFVYSRITFIKSPVILLENFSARLTNVTALCPSHVIAAAT